MNMFGMDHMLKDGWSGFYSQGYMYFDNCSSLFLPRVNTTHTQWITTLNTSLVQQLSNVWGFQVTSSLFLCSVCSPRCIIQTSTHISPSPAQRWVTDHELTVLIILIKSSIETGFLNVFVLSLQSDPSNQSLFWPDKPVRHVGTTFM